MTWALVLGGLALVIVGLIGLNPPRSLQGKQPREPVLTNPTTEADAWEILADPIISYEPVRADHPKGGNRGFGRGVVTGLGTGLLIWGLFLLVTPQQPPRVPLMNTPPLPTDSPPQTAVPPPAPTTPKPLTVLPDKVEFTIHPGELPDTVANRLAESGLVNNPGSFLERLTERGVDTKLQAGTFTIKTGSNLDEVIDALTT